MPISFASAAGILLLACALVGLTGVASAQTSDESGTLVMVARTADSVIVSVDSAITHNLGITGTDDIPAPPIDGQRKLVDVGEKSACTIEAFLGMNTDDLDVSAALRRWVKANPKIEAHEAIGSLLEEAGKTWDRQHYSLGDLPQDRTIGSPISRLTCGDIVDGHPAIIRGLTFVKSDGLGGQVASSRIPEPQNGDILYLEGALNIDLFVPLITNPSILENALARLQGQASNTSQSEQITEFSKSIAEFRGSVSTMAAFNSWQVADAQSFAGRQSGPGGSPVTYVPSSWTQSSVKDLFSPVFTAVELHLLGVAPPNNVRIITPCGRFDTTVEAETWQTCPPPVAVVVKKKKHWW